MIFYSGIQVVANLEDRINSIDSARRVAAAHPAPSNYPTNSPATVDEDLEEISAEQELRKSLPLP